MNHSAQQLANKDLGTRSYLRATPLKSSLSSRYLAAASKELVPDQQIEPSFSTHHSPSRPTPESKLSTPNMKKRRAEELVPGYPKKINKGRHEVNGVEELSANILSPSRLKNPHTGLKSHRDTTSTKWRSWKVHDATERGNFIKQSSGQNSNRINTHARNDDSRQRASGKSSSIDGLTLPPNPALTTSSPFKQIHHVDLRFGQGHGLAFGRASGKHDQPIIIDEDSDSDSPDYSSNPFRSPAQPHQYKQRGRETSPARVGAVEPRQVSDQDALRPVSSFPSPRLDKPPKSTVANNAIEPSARSSRGSDETTQGACTSTLASNDQSANTKIDNKVDTGNDARVSEAQSISNNKQAAMPAGTESAHGEQVEEDQPLFIEQPSQNTPFAATEHLETATVDEFAWAPESRPTLGESVAAATAQGDKCVWDPVKIASTTTTIDATKARKPYVSVWEYSTSAEHSAPTSRNSGPSAQKLDVKNPVSSGMGFNLNPSEEQVKSKGINAPSRIDSFTSNLKTAPAPIAQTPGLSISQRQGVVDISSSDEDEDEYDDNDDDELAPELQANLDHFEVLEARIEAAKQRTKEEQTARTGFLATKSTEAAKTAEHERQEAENEKLRKEIEEIQNGRLPASVPEPTAGNARQQQERSTVKTLSLEEAVRLDAKNKQSQYQANRFSKLTASKTPNGAAKNIANPLTERILSDARKKSESKSTTVPKTSAAPARDQSSTLTDLQSADPAHTRTDKRKRDRHSRILSHEKITKDDITAYRFLVHKMPWNLLYNTWVGFTGRKLTKKSLQARMTRLGRTVKLAEDNGRMDQLPDELRLIAEQQIAARTQFEHNALVETGLSDEPETIDMPSAGDESTKATSSTASDELQRASPELARRAQPLPNLETSKHSTTGGKSIDPDQQRRALEELAIRKALPDCSDAEMSNDEAGEVEDQSDEEEHRDTSPITDADKCYYAYHVERKVWRLTEPVDDVEWVRTTDAFSSLAEANKAAGEEFARERGDWDVWPLEEWHCTVKAEDYNMVKYYGSSSYGSVMVEVARTLRSYNDGRLPTSKDGWLTKKLFDVMVTTTIEYEESIGAGQTKQSSLSEENASSQNSDSHSPDSSSIGTQEARNADSSNVIDNTVSDTEATHTSGDEANELDDLFEEHVQLPAAVTSNENDKTKSPIPEHHITPQLQAPQTRTSTITMTEPLSPSSLSTTLDMANRTAASHILTLQQLLTPRRQRHHKDAQKRFSAAQSDMDERLDAMEQAEELFVETVVFESGTVDLRELAGTGHRMPGKMSGGKREVKRTVEVAVVERELVGPRNI